MLGQELRQRRVARQTPPPQRQCVIDRLPRLALYPRNRPRRPDSGPTAGQTPCSAWCASAQARICSTRRFPPPHRDLRHDLGRLRCCASNAVQRRAGGQAAVARVQGRNDVPPAFAGCTRNRPGSLEPASGRGLRGKHRPRSGSDLWSVWASSAHPGDHGGRPEVWLSDPPAGRPRLPFFSAKSIFAHDSPGTPATPPVARFGQRPVAAWCASAQAEDLFHGQPWGAIGRRRAAMRDQEDGRATSRPAGRACHGSDWS